MTRDRGISYARWTLSSSAPASGSRPRDRAAAGLRPVVPPMSVHQLEWLEHRGKQLPEPELPLRASRRSTLLASGAPEDGLRVHALLEGRRPRPGEVDS